MDPSAIAKLVGELLIAIQALSGYAVPAAQPTVVFVPHAVLEREACAGPCDVYGWFPPGQTIYLDDRLNPLADAAARGVLVHELVHYLQQESGAFAAPIDCRSWTDREWQAYDIQLRWLQRRSPRLAAKLRFGYMPLRRVCDDGRAPPSG